MSLPPPPPPFPPAAARPARWRQAALGLAVGGVLGLGIGVPAALLADRLPSPSAVGSTPAAGGDTPGETPGGTLPGGGGVVDQSALTQRQGDATDAESTGLVLVETTLTSGAGAGTGMVLTDDGTVLTNYHVVEGATGIQVTVAATGETYAAEVVGHDQDADVALLRLDGASGLTTVTPDDDGGATTGDDVTVVGNSEGQGYLSAASGDVLATEQDITTADEVTGTDHDLSGLLETDAYAVPGDSGGAVLDDEGEVVGVTTAVSSGQTVHSYAVPIADALEVVQQIESGVETDTVQIGPGAYLGITVGSDAVTGSGSGVSVSGVEDDGPAAAAGLAAGDAITAVDGTTVGSLADAQAVLAGHDPGDVVTLAWTTSGGGAQSGPVTLGESPID